MNGDVVDDDDDDDDDDDVDDDDGRLCDAPTFTLDRQTFERIFIIIIITHDP